MRSEGIARHDGHATCAVDNGDDKAAAKTRQGGLASALVCVQNEVSVRAVRLVGRIREGLAIEEQAMKEPTKGTPLRPSYAAGQSAARLVKCEREHPIAFFRFGRKGPSDCHGGLARHDAMSPSLLSRSKSSFTSSAARASSTSNSSTRHRTIRLTSRRSPIIAHTRLPV